MKIRIEYEEHTRRVIDVEAESIEAAQAIWAERYDSEVLDEWLEQSVEVDGGTDWDSATFIERVWVSP